MTLHKLTAGDGYQYLTRQTAAADQTLEGGTTLGDYYSEKGERPGQWFGNGLAGLAVGDVSTTGAVAHGSVVTSEQMAALFGVGRHPNADQIEAAVTAEQVALGRTPKQAEKAADAASRLGRVFDSPGDPSEFVLECARAYEAYNVENQRPRSAAIDAEVRAQIRTAVGRDLFKKRFERDPADKRELSGFIARESRPRQQACAGFDLTFSPVKSVSTLWAVADLDTAKLVQGAHEAAVRDAIGWLEREVIYTRRGAQGARVVETEGVLAAGFVHRDNRNGDPDLHTHVAIANKVRDPEDGAWLSIDGSVLYKHTVAASERYNSRLEAELSQRLGVQWRTVRNARSEKRNVRELVGIEDSLIAAWSSRRAHIEARLTELTDQFQAAHGRVPTAKESYALAQQANLETREAKGEHRSWEEQRSQWLSQASTVLGSPDQVQEMVAKTVNSQRASHADFAAEHGQTLANLREKIAVQGTVHDDDIHTMAAHVVDVVTHGHAVFQHAHLAAETERLARTLDISAAARAAGPDLVSRVVTTAESALEGEPLMVTLTTAQSALEASPSPSGMSRRDGSSQYVTPHSRLYTTTRVLAAEQALVRAAGQRGGRILTDEQVAIGLLSETANGVDLNRGQRHLVSEMATSGARLQLALAPAGTGKTTAMRALATSWVHSGGDIIALAPSAAAAAELGSSVGATGSTLARFVGVATGRSKDRDGTFAALGPDALVIIDEAGMASTSDLHAAVDYALTQGASVRLIGDDQQLAAVGAGGALRDIATTHGALTLDEVVRFKTPGEAAASLALRSGAADEALGFYLDHSRVRASSPTTITDEVYAAWASERAAGREALMIASTRDQVNELNGRARAERLEIAGERPESSVVLESGLEASAGDTIVTRLNHYRLRIGARDFVKNGDRWNVDHVNQDGSLTVTHNDLGRQVRLPADYVAEHVDLGYATTVHGAQGQTVESCFAIITGAESRQLAYVALTRGRGTNQAFVQVGGDADPHNMLTPDAVLPKTAAEVLYVVFGRDGSAVSATTTSTEELSPQARLAYAASVYNNAVGRAAEVHVGVERLAVYAERAEELAPTITQSRSWPLLAQHLALLETGGTDPLADLSAAVKRRPLDDALDLAVVVLWRLSPTHLRGGPLEWLPKVPSSLEATYTSWLGERAAEVTTAAEELREQARAWTYETAPAWAQPLLADDGPRIAPAAGRDDSHDLVADLAVWRVAKGVDDTDLRAAGPRPSSRSERPTWDRLVRRVADRTVDPETTSAGWWSKQIHTQQRVTQDPWWPVLATRLDELAIREDWISDEILDGIETRLAERATQPIPTTGTQPADPTGQTESTDRTDTAASTAAGDDSLSSEDARLVEAHEAAAAFYRDHLENSWASESLIQRGMGHLIDPADPAGAGYAPRDPHALSRHLTGLGFTADELIAAGLAMPAKDGEGITDRFRDRLMLPIFDTIEGQARPVGFTGRKKPGSPDYIPKYLNTSATSLYDKSSLLDGLATHADLLRNGARPVLVEGRLDAEAVTLASGGAAVGLATGGTALTPGHLAALGQVVDLSTTPVVAAYDNDNAGRKAAARAWKLLQEAGCTDSRAAALPAGADPAQLVETGDSDELAKSVLETTTPLISRRVSARIADWAPVLDHLDGKFGLIDTVARDLGEATPEEYGIAVAQLLVATDLDVDVFHARLDEAMSSDQPSPEAHHHDDQPAGGPVSDLVETAAADVPNVPDPAGEEPYGRVILAALLDDMLEEPLPDEHAAAALWARLRDQIEDMPDAAAGNGPSTPERALLEHVDLDEAARVMGTPQWQQIDEALRAGLREDPDAYALEMNEQIARARSEQGRIDENRLVGALRPTLPTPDQQEPTTRRTPLPTVKRPSKDLTPAERARRAAQIRQDRERERIRREQQRQHDHHHRGPDQGPGGPRL